MLATAATSSSPAILWYLTRGTGVVALILLTLTLALGIANIRRLETRRVPRFVIEAVHRNISLLAVIFLLVHIATSVMDTFVSISWLNAVIPWGDSYRPLWLGVGAVSFDLMIAVVLTSLVRRRIGHRVWRAVHWAAYLSWPTAVLHGIEIGTDRHTTWMLAITIGCGVIVLAALIARLTALGAAPDAALTPLQPAPRRRVSVT
jgi:methionine sulfoxide reductase heme-binding subunit